MGAFEHIMAPESHPGRHKPPQVKETNNAKHGWQLIKRGPSPLPICWPCSLPYQFVIYCDILTAPSWFHHLYPKEPIWHAVRSGHNPKSSSRISMYHCLYPQLPEGCSISKRTLGIAARITRKSTDSAIKQGRHSEGLRMITGSHTAVVHQHS